MRLSTGFAALAAIVALSGCLKAPMRGKDASLTDSSPGINTGKLDAQGEADFLLAYQYVRSAKVTTNMPNSGSASYVGGMGSDVSGDINGFLTGAMDVKVHDLNNGSVTGTVDDFALYGEDGKKKRDLGGALVISGNVAGNKLNSTAAGSIVDNKSGSPVASNTTLTMDGTFRDLSGRGSAVTGTVTGGGNGGFNFLLDDGLFYLVEDD